MTSRLLEIEEHALGAWPPAETAALSGWQLRAMSGVSRRANSVWTGRASGSLSLEQRIARAEDFYRSRSLPPNFQIGTECQPQNLDAILSARGYELVAPVSVQVAQPRDVAAVVDADRVRCEISRALSETWFDLSARRGRFAGVEEIYRGLLLRLGSRAVFATAFVDDCPAAVGLGVVGSRWFGISSMFTLPACRGRGAARALLRALARHAQTCGDPQLYLQVERENRPALALYSRIGFVDHHAYHYRQRAPVGP